MPRRKHNVDELVQLFRGKIDDPRDFFERVISCRHHGEDRGGVVIPYRSVVEFYNHELHFFKDTAGKHQRLCVCGCGKPVFGQHKYASEACRKRRQRQKVTA
jgi:hypothetical protein